MRLIARGFLRNYWAKPGRHDSETPLKTWADVVRKARWSSYDDVKAAYGANVDLAYRRQIFNIGGNKYRLICRIGFQRHGVLTLWVGTHAEYDVLCDDGGKRLQKL